MQRNIFPSAADLIFVVAAPLTAIFGAVKLTQADGDLSAHIRMGRVILATGHIPTHSLASYTAGSGPMVGHAWLAEIFFATLFRVGGLPLICVFAGIVVGLTHGAIALFLRRRGVDPRWAFLAALLSFALAATHWLARPHLFSIVGSALTLFLLESERTRRQLYFVLLYAVWVNLHGGWAYGLAVIAMYIAGDLAEALLSTAMRAEWLARAKQNAISFVLAAAATIANPFGWAIYREVFFAATSSSLAKNMAEFQPPNFQAGSQWAFLTVLLLTVVLLSLSVRRMSLPWLAVVIMSLFFALRSFRNIALFGVTAWPLIALHVARAFPRGRRFPLFTEFAKLDPGTRVGMYGAPVAVMMLALGLNRGSIDGLHLIADRFDSKAMPVAAVDRAQAAQLQGRVFDKIGRASCRERV